MNTMTEPLVLDFTDKETAYKYKSTGELKRAAFMFKFLNTPVIGPIGKTALKFAVSVGLPVKGAVKATLYKQFVGGETLQDCLPIVEKMDALHVESILDYSVEGAHDEAHIQMSYNELLYNIKFASEHKSIPFSVFKTTGFAASGLLEKVSAGLTLTADETTAWNKVKERFYGLCRAAYDQRVKLMIDAEETWTQKAIDDLAMDMMQKYNQQEAYIINTFQLYRKDRLDYFKECHVFAKKNGFKLGAKLVRGAYMEKERARALQKGYPSPIQDTKDDTDKDYNKAMIFGIDNLEDILTFIGSHNEGSCRMAAEKIHEYGIPENHPHVWFSQLYGMCDHISFNLAKAGCNVAKYVPYGPVKSVTPYLIRRADENSSVAGQAKIELGLIEAEIKRRKG